MQATSNCNSILTYGICCNSSLRIWLRYGRRNQTWGAPKEYSDTKNNKSDDANQSGTMWMLLRAFKASGTHVPPPPQLMCEIAPQFNQY